MIVEEERSAAKKAMKLALYQYLGDIASQIEYALKRQKHGQPVPTIGQNRPEDIINSLWERLLVLETIMNKEENELTIDERRILGEIL